MSKEGVYGVNSALFSAQPAIPSPKWSGLDISQLNPGTSRVIGHIIITIVMWSASTLGESAMVNFARRSLKRGDTVPVTHLLGWSSLGQSFSSVFKTRRLPGGFAWFTPMILTVLSGTLANLLLAGYTTGVAVSSTCGGQIQMAVANTSTGTTDAGAPRQPLFLDSMQAQVYSLANGGLQGIYHAAPVDPLFKAAETDIAGEWQCSLSWTQTWPQPANSKAIGQFLTLAGGNNGSSSCGSRYGYYVNCWGVSLDWSNPSNLQIFIALEIPLSNNTFAVNPVGAPNTVDGYLCTFSAVPAFNYVQARVDGPSFTAALGAAIATRTVYNRTVMHEVIELVSNALLTVNTYAPYDSEIYSAGAEYGCVKMGTRVELPACVLIIACVVASLGWGVVAGIAKIGTGETAKVVPVGLRGWMDQAIREVGAPDITYDTEVTAARRRDWAMAMKPASGWGPARLGLVDQRYPSQGFVAPEVQQPYSNTGYPPSPSGPSFSERTPSAIPLLAGSPDNQRGLLV